MCIYFGVSRKEYLVDIFKKVCVLERNCASEHKQAGVLEIRVELKV